MFTQNSTHKQNSTKTHLQENQISDILTALQDRDISKVLELSKQKQFSLEDAYAIWVQISLLDTSDYEYALLEPIQNTCMELIEKDPLTNFDAKKYYDLTSIKSVVDRYNQCDTTAEQEVLSLASNIESEKKALRQKFGDIVRAIDTITDQLSAKKITFESLEHRAARKRFCNLLNKSMNILFSGFEIDPNNNNRRTLAPECNEYCHQILAAFARYQSAVYNLVGEYKPTVEATDLGIFSEMIDRDGFISAPIYATYFTTYWQSGSLPDRDKTPRGRLLELKNAFGQYFKEHLKKHHVVSKEEKTQNNRYDEEGTESLHILSCHFSNEIWAIDEFYCRTPLSSKVLDEVKIIVDSTIEMIDGYIKQCESAKSNLAFGGANMRKEAGLFYSRHFSASSTSYAQYAVETPAPNKGNIEKLIERYNENRGTSLPLMLRDKQPLSTAASVYQSLPQPPTQSMLDREDKQQLVTSSTSAQPAPKSPANPAKPASTGILGWLTSPWAKKNKPSDSSTPLLPKGKKPGHDKNEDNEEEIQLPSLNLRKHGYGSLDS